MAHAAGPPKDLPRWRGTDDDDAWQQRDWMRRQRARRGEAPIAALVPPIGLGLGVLGVWQQAGAVVGYAVFAVVAAGIVAACLRSWMVVASAAVTFAFLVPVLLVGVLIYLGHHGDVNCDADSSACGTRPAPAGNASPQGRHKPSPRLA